MTTQITAVAHRNSWSWTRCDAPLNVMTLRARGAALSGCKHVTNGGVLKQAGVKEQQEEGAFRETEKQL